MNDHPIHDKVRELQRAGKHWKLDGVVVDPNVGEDTVEIYGLDGGTFIRFGLNAWNMAKTELYVGQPCVQTDLTGEGRTYLGLPVAEMGRRFPTFGGQNVPRLNQPCNPKPRVMDKFLCAWCEKNVMGWKTMSMTERDNKRRELSKMLIAWEHYRG